MWLFAQCCAKFDTLFVGSAGQLVQSDAVLPLPRHAPRLHQQPGGERQAGEAHQGLR